MFQIGDYVIYGYEGVCRVAFVGHPKISGLDRQKEYYCLEPVDRNGQIYTPLDTKTAMRPLHSRQTVETLLAAVPDSQPLPTDVQHAGEYYRDILRTQDFSRCLGLYYALNQRKQQLSARRKTLNVTDQRYMKQVEESLCSEIGFVLGLSTADALKRLQQSCSASLSA